MQSIDRNDPQRASHDRSVLDDFSAEERRLFDQIGCDAAQRGDVALDVDAAGGRAAPLLW